MTTLGQLVKLQEDLKREETLKTMEKVAEALARPKKVVRDDSGRVAGLQ